MEREVRAGDLRSFCDAREAWRVYGKSDKSLSAGSPKTRTNGAGSPRRALTLALVWFVFGVNAFVLDFHESDQFVDEFVELFGILLVLISEA